MANDVIQIYKLTINAVFLHTEVLIYTVLRWTLYVRREICYLWNQSELITWAQWEIKFIVQDFALQTLFKEQTKLVNPGITVYNVQSMICIH